MPPHSSYVDIVFHRERRRKRRWSQPMAAWSRGSRPIRWSARRLRQLSRFRPSGGWSPGGGIPAIWSWRPAPIGASLVSVDVELTVRFDGSVRIERSAQDVFALLADVQDFATVPGSPVAVMEKTPQGPTAVGTRWREVVRLGLGRTLTMWSEVTAIEPGRLLVLRLWGGNMRGDLVYTLTPCDTHTVLRQQETLVTSGVLRPFGLVDRPDPRASAVEAADRHSRSARAGRQRRAGSKCRDHLIPLR